MAVTLNDIARETGLSKQAVCAALSGKSTARISEAKRDLVIKTAQRLGYTRNRIASFMQKGRFDVIAVIYSEESGGGEHMQKILGGCLQALREHKFSLKLFSVKPQNMDATIEEVRELQVAGVLFHVSDFSFIETAIKVLNQAQIPCGVVNLPNQGDYGFGAFFDDESGVAAAVHYLYECGHRKIAFVTHRYHLFYIEKRLQGFLRGCRECRMEYVIIERPWDYEFGSSDTFFKEILASKVSAAVCAGDNFAAEVLYFTYKYHMRVPDDLSLIGFGGYNICEYSVVPLSTVVQPYHQLGYESAQLLLAAVEKSENINGREIILPVKLKIGDSCRNI